MQLTDFGLLILRVILGLTFAAHGAQKAFGWWGGPGYVGWTKAIAKMRYWPAPFWAAVSTAAELVGGILIVLGLLTPFAAAFFVGQLAVIILRVHLPLGFWNAKGGIEFPLQLFAGTVVTLTAGPGAIALDSVLGILPVEVTLRFALVAITIVGALLAIASQRVGAAQQEGARPGAA